VARFGQQFLAGLLQPSYQQGLFTAAQQLGARPRQMAEKRQEQQMLGGLVPGTPEYNEALAKLQMQRGQLTEAAATGAAAATQRQAATKAAEETATRSRLMGSALKKAKDDKSVENYSAEAARITSMSAEELQQYLTPKEPKDPIQLVTGARLVDPDTNKVLIEARDAPAKQVNVAYELFKTGKYDPTSFKYDDNGNLLGDLSSVRLATDPKERGGIPTNVENRMIEMDTDSAKSIIQFGRARKLKEDLMASPDKKAGIVSALRTQVLDFAGLRDVEEERKTEFLRTRNTDIVNGLPPGVASDRDIEIFSQGFPSGDAKAEEIIRYLEAEERILAAQSDMSALFQQHVNKLVEDGIEATTAGFEEERRKYANIMTAFREKVEFATNEQGQPLYTEEQKRRFLQEALGFVPTYYSR
jgi:hypothetical protein